MHREDLTTRGRAIHGGPIHTMTQDIEKYVEEFARFYGHADLVSVEDAKHEHGVDWVEDTLTKVAEEAYKAGYIKGGLDEQVALNPQKVAEEARQEERERIVEYVQKAYCTQEHKDKHYCGFNDGEQVCDCYNEALDDLITHLSDK